MCLARASTTTFFVLRRVEDEEPELGLLASIWRALGRWRCTYADDQIAVRYVEKSGGPEGAPFFSGLPLSSRKFVLSLGGQDSFHPSITGRIAHAAG
jgi:hypothetical protein